MKKVGMLENGALLVMMTGDELRLANMAIAEVDSLAKVAVDAKGRIVGVLGKLSEAMGESMGQGAGSMAQRAAAGVSCCHGAEKGMEPEGEEVRAGGQAQAAVMKRLLKQHVKNVTGEGTKPENVVKMCEICGAPAGKKKLCGKVACVKAWKKAYMQEYWKRHPKGKGQGARAPEAGTATVQGCAGGKGPEAEGPSTRAQKRTVRGESQKLVKRIKKRNGKAEQAQRAKRHKCSWCGKHAAPAGSEFCVDSDCATLSRNYQEHLKKNTHTREYRDDPLQRMGMVAERVRAEESA